MVERNRFLKLYAPLTPPQRNAELRGLFEMMPTEPRDYPAKSYFDFDPQAGKLVFTGDHEEFDSRVNEGVDRMRKRGRSDLKSVLTDKLGALLTYTQTTKSCREYIADQFNGLFDMGIDRDNVGISSELEDLGRLFRWNDPRKGGIFDITEASEIDNRAYRRAVYFQLLSKGIDECCLEKEMAEASEWIDLMQKARDDEVSFGILKQAMNDEELAKVTQQEQESDEIVQNIEQKWAEQEARVKKWRFEYIALYDNEP